MPTTAYPLQQSYVDTCMAGCLEMSIPGWAHDFVRTTDGWEHCWIDDRQQRLDHARDAIPAQAEEFEPLL